MRTYRRAHDNAAQTAGNDVPASSMSIIPLRSANAETMKRDASPVKLRPARAPFAARSAHRQSHGRSTDPSGLRRGSNPEIQRRFDVSIVEAFARRKSSRRLALFA